MESTGNVSFYGNNFTGARGVSFHHYGGKFTCIMSSNGTDYVLNDVVLAIATSTFMYLTWLRLGDNIYFMLDGTLKGIIPLPNNYIQYDNSNSDKGYNSIGDAVGGSGLKMRGYMDDILLSVGDSIINPTGKSVGQKVFEPPVRGGFDGTFKQY